MAAPGERVVFASPYAGAGGKIIASPFQFLTDDDDNLRVVSVNSLTGVTLAVQGRRLDANGQVQAIAEVHTPNTNRTTKTQDYKLGKGAILNLTVFASAGAPLMGQTYVIVQLIKGLSGGKIVLGTLLGGYLTAVQALGWPGSPIISSTDGEGVTRTITGTTPAAEADILETVPTGARWELLAIRASITRGVGGVAGTARLILDDGANAFQDIIGTVSGGASTTSPYVFAQHLVAQTVAIAGGQLINSPIGANRLRAAHRIQLIRTADASAEQWTAPIYNVREWLEVG